MVSLVYNSNQRVDLPHNDIFLIPQNSVTQNTATHGVFLHDIAMGHDSSQRVG